MYRFTAEDMEKGRSYFEQAVTMQPGYAPAWVQLADYYIASAFFCLAPPCELLLSAKEAARKALNTDPDLNEAHAVLGWVEALTDHNCSKRSAGLVTRSVLNAGPALTVMTAAAVGKTDSAFEALDRALQKRDPSLVRMIRSPYLQPLQSDPRYPELLKEMNLATETP